ncbi:hypothetical protein ABB37_02461 [Leptomonas pyrrhocoris]|uniref:Clathrin light chain n=1 Tax=Leptomonas pyrrhocoris TaxID=157538 RepID=A0A0N0DX59_LEPPY|nr:hypothetical protein ABB37_02461 [Leptomonas pyrrhocoris]XP_015661054.1 hypothetical protein ABB37_02461 [Leptomonas pyrrhocoris]KPA82614.1 hypothetical protein ABB37_02461 [Leptomonas pyrrhocoris]KPA82615.1 hypothetical protein ABB37_02461 [Leptomonas pyrrhocoris]|eukprot:XP_015661053.1 hypothetical protein ABB37_02461 [Leptomonas pyrrhocoris]
MNDDQAFNFAPKQGAPASPFDEGGSPFGAEANSPPSIGSAAGGNAPPNRFTDAAAPSQHSPASMSAHSGTGEARPNAVKAPWDDDDDWNTPSAPAPAQPAAPGSPPAADEKPASSFLPAPAAPVSAAVPPSQPSQDSMSPFSASPAEPRATPQSPPHGGVNGFIASSPPPGSPNRPPTPPEKPSAVNTAKMDALNKQVASRTAAYDAATKEKESKILAAAQEFIKAQKAKREKEVSEAKANHKKDQQTDANKIDAYKKSGAVWNAVGMLVDLQKPNQYSKGTEQMRSIFSILNATPAAPAATAVKK